MIVLPTIGQLDRSDYSECVYLSAPISIDYLDGDTIQFLASICQEDTERASRYDKAIAEVLRLGALDREIASLYIYEYYTRCRYYEDEDCPMIVIDPAEDVWIYVEIRIVCVTISEDDSRDVCVSFQGQCDWDPEHGIQIVYLNGKSLVRVGPDDGNCYQGYISPSSRYEQGIVDAF